MFVTVWVTSHLTVLAEDPRLFLSLGLASALGGSAYWFVIRFFWLKSLKSVDLMMTAAMCAGN
jgi:hypothetical protein